MPPGTRFSPALPPCLDNNYPTLGNLTLPAHRFTVTSTGRLKDVFRQLRTLKGSQSRPFFPVRHRLTTFSRHRLYTYAFKKYYSLQAGRCQPHYSYKTASIYCRKNFYGLRPMITYSLEIVHTIPDHSGLLLIFSRTRLTLSFRFRQASLLIRHPCLKRRPRTSCPRARLYLQLR
jgi:hypothetical protein